MLQNSYFVIHSGRIEPIQVRAVPWVFDPCVRRERALLPYRPMRNANRNTKWAFRLVTFVLAAAFAVRHSPARAEDRTFALAMTVSEPGNQPVRDDAWIDAQIAEAERLFGPVGVHFRWTLRKIGKPEPSHVEIETREDRDALTDGLEPGCINVFVVRSLRDVDEPPRVRMGVTWTQRENKRRYVVLSSIAKPSVLAHELGHFFGNGHTTVVNNLMSYDRDGGLVFLSDEQKKRIGDYASGFARGGLVVLGPPRFMH
jgi:hypothetical protein